MLEPLHAFRNKIAKKVDHIFFLILVDGGHRAIMFSRLGGIKDGTYSEGLHFRVPWFEYPIIYDIR